MKKRHYVVMVGVVIVLLGLIVYAHKQDQGNFAYWDRLTTIDENGIYDILYKIHVGQLSIAGVTINGQRKPQCYGSSNYLIEDECRLLLLRGDKIGIWRIASEPVPEPRYSLQISQVNLNGVDSPKHKPTSKFWRMDIP